MASQKVLALSDGNVGMQLQILTPVGPIGASIVDGGGGGGGGVGNFAIFRPGAVTAAPAYATLAEILPLIAAADGAFTLYIDSSIAPAHVGAGVSLDGQARLTIAPAKGPQLGVAMLLTIDDGGQLVDPLAIVGQVNIDSATTTIPALRFTSAAQQMQLTQGAQLRLRSGATRAFLDVVPGIAVAFDIDFSSKYLTGALGIPVVQLTDAASVFTNFYTRISPFAQPDDNTVASAESSNFFFLHDASVTIPNFPAFNGTLTTFELDEGLVAESLVDFPLARLQAAGGVLISAFFPLFAVVLPNVRMLACEIMTVQNFNSPTITGATAQIFDAFTLAGFTGVADLDGGPLGPSAPYPPFMQTDANSNTHIPNLRLTITGDTFDNLTEGHVQARIVVAVNPRVTP